MGRLRSTGRVVRFDRTELEFSMTQADEHHLRRAIELRAAGDMPFGSLLVGPDGEVLVEDRNTVVTWNDVTAHPELNTALWASRNLERGAAARTTMHTSTEPCPMCRGAIARSGLGRVVFALSGEQFAGLKPPVSPSPDAAEVHYEGPALFDEARVPIDGYLRLAVWLPLLPEAVAKVCGAVAVG
jgi:tRNA(Arg) A34 adenosine deaminase TadA